MSIWQSKLDAIFQAADKADHRVQVLLVEPVNATQHRIKSYRVVMEYAGVSKRVGFNLTLRDAEIFQKAMPMKMCRVENPAPDGDQFERAQYKIEEE